MKVLVTGGCGYKGSVLVPKLLAEGYDVLVVDTQWFGRNLAEHPRLEVLQQDVRQPVNLDGVRAVVHLAGIANDPCGELDARLTWDVNVLATFALAKAAAKAGVEHFVFASSASIYGIKDNKPVEETDPFEPVSDYNKTKMVAEQLLAHLRDDMLLTFLRPATVCGVSPRQRLDVIVNLLTLQALEKHEITAHVGKHGGSLMRPHMHIEDVTDLYVWTLKNRITGAYNAASANQTIEETAALIASEVNPCSINFTEVADKRSYAVNFDKLTAAGFSPKRSVLTAIRDLAGAYGRDMLRRDPSTVNLKWMRYHGWAS